MKMNPREWTTADAITIVGVLVALVAILVGVTTPEIRQALGLDSAPANHAQIIKGSLYNEVQPQSVQSKPNTRQIARTESLPMQAPAAPLQLASNQVKTLQESAEEESQPSQSSPAPTRSLTVQDNVLLFVLKSCRRLDRNVFCAGSLTNRADKERRVGLGYSSNAVDELGNQYNVGDNQLQLGSAGQWQMLEPDLPVNFSVTVNDVNPSANQISVVLGYGAEQAGPAVPNVQWQKAVFRHVPILSR